MTIDTGKKTIRLQVQKQMFAVLVGILFAVCYFPAPLNFLDTYLFSHYLVSSSFIVLYILYQLYFWVRDLSYLFASDEVLEGMLCIRYFRILPMVNAKRAIELPQHELLRYEVEKRWYGLRSYVRIWQQQGSELYVFPAFSISLLRKQEKQNLFALLEKYQTQK